jgi:hypothetical protein
VKRMQIEATPLVLGDSSIARHIRQMARAATGQPAAEEKKRASVIRMTAFRTDNDIAMEGKTWNC